jgi:hypothetical protein
MQLLGLQPGTWADWANAISTTLAFTVALVLFVIGLRDRRNAADDRLRDQARRIWIHTSGTHALPVIDSEHRRVDGVSGYPHQRRGHQQYPSWAIEHTQGRSRC